MIKLSGCFLVLSSSARIELQGFSSIKEVRSWANHFTSEGAGERWGEGLSFVVGIIFFQPINFTMNFFLKYAFARYFFSPSNTLRDFFCAWMGLKK